ncbi:MAG: OmpA family protein [Bacteroidota bacterium]
MTIKQFIIIILQLFIVGSSTLFGQIRDIEDAPFNYSFYSKRNADSLINLGIYYQFGRGNEDFRTLICLDSLSKKYNFKFMASYAGGCLMEFWTRSIDSMPWFDEYMGEHLTKINGPDWKNKFENEVKECANTICGTKSQIDSFYYNSQFGGGIMFEINDSKLNDISKCILDFQLLQILKKYPSLKFEIGGYMTVDENNTSVSLQRAINIQKYFISKGISKNRLTVKNYKFGTNYKPSVKMDCIRQNRIVKFRVIGT